MFETMESNEQMTKTPSTDVVVTLPFLSSQYRLALPQIGGTVCHLLFIIYLFYYNFFFSFEVAVKLFI